jgi:hypothetical protein
MRKFLATTLLAGSLTLGGCATTDTGWPTIDVEQVRLVAVQICGFLPVADTVVEIIGLGNPLLSSASAVAAAICDSVTRPGAARGVIPHVNGVPVRGRFVK